MAALAAFDSTVKGFFDSLSGIMPFKPESKALGGSKKIVKDVVKQEISSPLGDLSNFFAGIDKSLINLVNFAKESLGIEKKTAQRKKLDRQDTDKKSKVKGGDKSMLDSLKESFASLGDTFGEMSIGEKLGAALLVGSLLIFQQVQGALVTVITPVISILKGLVSFLGVGGTFNLFLVTFLAFKVGLAQFVIKLAARKMGFTTLSAAFKSLQLFLGTTLPKSILSTFKAGPMALATKLLGGAFKALRLMLTATMYPAIIAMVTTLQAAMGPILGPIVVIAAILAGITAVLFSMKSGFEAFKNSLESGDSMITAIGKGLLDFSATLITLPITLLKNLLGYIAGLLGFDGIKEAIDNFSFKDMIVNAFTGLISGTIKLIKAIAKGAAAALAAAFPGGEGPGEAFGRVFKEVMSGGEGTILAEGSEKGGSTPEIGLDSEFIVPTEKIKPVEAPTLSTAKAAMTTNESYITNDNTVNNETNVMKEKIKELIKEGTEKERIERESKSSAPIMVSTNKGGDTHVSNSTTNVAGEPNTDHSETTQKLLTYAI